MFFFFNNSATTEIYTLSLHDALPICLVELWLSQRNAKCAFARGAVEYGQTHYRVMVIFHVAFLLACVSRSEEHTSELQSQSNLVCRLLLEKKKKKKHITFILIYFNNY